MLAPRNRPAPQNRPWLIMFYMAGGGGLAEEMVLSLQDLLLEGPPRGAFIAAQFDPSGSGLDTQRYTFRPGSRGSLEDHRDKTFTGYDVNTGSAEALAEFIRWALGHDPDEQMNRLLVLSGHGGGTSDDFLLRDENSLDALSMSELQAALRMGTRGLQRPWIDILGMDACFMSMGEVAYQIRRHAHILIGAEGLEPAFGWPYRRILARAKSNADGHLDPERLAALIVGEYVEHYSDYDRAAGRSADLSAIDLQQLQPVVDEFSRLVGQLLHLDETGHNRLLVAHWYAQTYKSEQFVDLWDLCDQMRKQFSARTGIPERCRAVIRALRACRIRSGVTGFAYQFSQGLSIYFPWAYVSPDYRKLDFPRQTNWERFLLVHVAATRRQPRFGPRRAAFEQLRRQIRRSATQRETRLLRLKETRRRRARREGIDADLRRQFAALLGTSVVANRARNTRLDRVIHDIAGTDIPERDLPSEITRRFFRGATFGDHNSRYTGGASRYTGGASRYTGGASKYTGGASRSPADRELAVKNLPPAIGKDFNPR